MLKCCKRRVLNLMKSIWPDSTPMGSVAVLGTVTTGFGRFAPCTRGYYCWKPYGLFISRELGKSIL